MKTKKCSVEGCSNVLDWKNDIKIDSKKHVCKDCYDQACMYHCTGVPTFDRVQGTFNAMQKLHKAEAEFFLTLRKMRVMFHTENPDERIDPKDLLAKWLVRARKISVDKYAKELPSINEGELYELLKLETARYQELYGDKLLPLEGEGGGYTERLRSFFRIEMEKPVFTDITLPSENQQEAL